MRYTPSISKEVSLSFLSNCRHGTPNWRDLQSRGLKPVYGSMGLQAFFHQLDRIWGHTGAGSLRYCFILYIFYLSLNRICLLLKGRMIEAATFERSNRLLLAFIGTDLQHFMSKHGMMKWEISRIPILMNATHIVLTNALVLFVHITHRYVGGFGFCQLWRRVVETSS